MPQSLDELRQRREYDCRLTPDRALASISQAHDFVRQRGLLTRTADCALPSLYGACHEEPYQAGGRGFASWPATKWPWMHELSEYPDVHSLDLHRGKTILLTDELLALADPICRAELARMEERDPGSRLLRHLAQAGPSVADDVQLELGLTAKALRQLRAPLQRCGALVARSVVLPAAGHGDGHVHRSELARWDQAYAVAAAGPADMVALLGAALRAAVLAPEKDLPRWFSWRGPAPAELAGQLIERGLAVRPGPGWLAAADPRT
jgi:hypothetical protein